jgi:hypothetical protein
MPGVSYGPVSGHEALGFPCDYPSVATTNVKLQDVLEHSRDRRQHRQRREHLGTADVAGVDDALDPAQRRPPSLK